MDKSLQTLCSALKKIIWQLKPQNNPLSFVILTGKTNQGKTTILRQSHFEHVTIESDRPVDIYFNANGIIVELSETWLLQSKNLLQYTLKHLNRCHRSVKITGLILCIDIKELLTAEPIQSAENIKLHTQLLTRFGINLHYRVEVAFIFCKLDALAGFCEFFQNQHASELQKPLGFSLDWGIRQGKMVNNFRSKFEQLIHTLGQQVIQKMHPARSSVKRTLIREFPLQLSTLGPVIQHFVLALSPKLFRVQAIYFTSGEQGGFSTDRLNKKIQHEYALIVQDQFPQSVNHRAYFIEGALTSFQEHTKYRAQNIMPSSHKLIAGAMASIVSFGLLWIGNQYLKSSHSLDAVSKELLAYDTLNKHNNGDDALSLYHLAKASNTLEHLTGSAIFQPSLQQLKTQLSSNTKEHLQGNFLPTVLSELEQTIIDSRQTQPARYRALKIYLMLGEPIRFSQKEVLAWFQEHWQAVSPNENIQKKMALLKQALRQPLQPIAINRQIVTDVRNYLNALPASYLFYTLAKDNFPQERKPLHFDGFELVEKELPVYFSKAGFQQVISIMPIIGAQLQAENWVLARQDLNDLVTLLKQAYCYEYVVWWQNFMRKSAPLHFQDFQQARHLTESLHQSNAFNKLVDLIQMEISPEMGENAALFNQEIASKFTELSLVSQSTVRDITVNMNELEKFLMTLSVVNDHGRTSFTLVKSRFDGDTLSNPLSSLYVQVNKLPEPVSSWAKQVADDTWFILINDARTFINQTWQQTVIREYQYSIARRYPFDATQSQEVAINDFERFFSSRGTLNAFVDQYLKPFLDTSQAQWQLKELNNYVMPISSDMINELIRANVISNMFFPDQSNTSKIEFSLQKISLDPVIQSLQLVIGNTRLLDTQDSEATVHFHWPQPNARLTLNSIEGNHYELEEIGPWAFFRMLQKVNVLVDDQDNSNLQILFEVNGNSGRYALKTQNQVNPFIPGILNGFILNDVIA